jgi:hypothetical protein
VKWREDVSKAGFGFCLIKNSSEKYGLYKRIVGSTNSGGENQQLVT